MTIDLIIKNGMIAMEGEGMVNADLAIEGGRITAMGANLNGKSAEKVIDATGMQVLPGAIDPHSHTNDPGYLNREDFAHAGRAALLGGVTTYIEMPLVKDIDDETSLKERINDGNKSALTDFSVYAGFIREKNYGAVKGLSKMGAMAFKIFTCRPFQASDDTIYKIEEETAATNSIATFHAEDETIINLMTNRLASRRDQIAVHEARPPEGEASAIHRVGIYSRLTHSPIHIAHLSSEMGAQTIRELKRLKVDITSETCPHYLIFTRKDVEKLGPYIKMSPSLKSSNDVDALWAALDDGTVEMVATDHAPGTRAEKEIGWEDPWKAWGGVPGLATMFPLLYTYGFIKGRLSLNSLLKVSSSNAASRFGLRGKGKLTVGNSADVIIIDPKYERKVEGADLYKVGYSPFDGMMLKGWPKYVIRRGELVVEDWELIAKAGSGRYIKMER